MRRRSNDAHAPRPQQDRRLLHRRSPVRALPPRLERARLRRRRVAPLRRPLSARRPPRAARALRPHGSSPRPRPRPQRWRSPRRAGELLLRLPCALLLRLPRRCERPLLRRRRVRLLLRLPCALLLRLPRRCERLLLRRRRALLLLRRRRALLLLRRRRERLLLRRRGVLL